MLLDVKFVFWPSANKVVFLIFHLSILDIKRLHSEYSPPITYSLKVLLPYK